MNSRLQPHCNTNARGTYPGNSGRFALSRQAGGTLTGLIVGLIVGLAIAVVVAIAITKTPMPFTNKLARPDKTDPAVGKPVDPNKPLYGNREPAKEASKGFVKPAEEDDPIATMAKRDAAPENQVKPDAGAISGAPGKAPIVEKSTVEKPKKPAKPDLALLGDKPQGDTAGGTKTEPADDKWTYFLQAGAFREAGDAENTRAKLALLGFEARITERPSDTGTLYRVRIGPFTQLETMNRMRSKLTDNGIDAAVVRTAK